MRKINISNPDELKKFKQITCAACLETIDFYKKLK